MNCRFCNEEIPEDSGLCSHCGRGLDEKNDIELPSEDSTSVSFIQLVDNENSSVIIKDKVHTSRNKNVFCKHCGKPIDSETHKCPTCSKKLFKISFKAIFFAITVLLLLASITYLVFQRKTFMNAISAAEAEITEKESFIHTLESDNISLEQEIESLNDQIKKSKTRISLLEEDSETLDIILSFLQSSNAGSASSKFKASDKIFVVDKHDIQTSFTLTCGFSGSTTVRTRNNGTSADIVFTQDRWYGATTKLLISPRSVGATVITFSNDQNTQTFKILIVVID